MINKIAFLLSIASALFGCSGENIAKHDAKVEEPRISTIYFGGDIITMENKTKPTYVEAIITADGKIVFTGTHSEASKKYPHAAQFDLKGQTLIPGFIDIHSHFSQTAIKLGLLSLDPPPAGDISNINDIIVKLSDELSRSPEKYSTEKDWLIGWGFDNGFLEEKRFPTRNDLDKISTTTPIALIHFSSHMLVLNSFALERAGYLSSEYNLPEGGILQKFDNSDEFNGVVEEQAMLAAFSKMGEDKTGKAGTYTSPQFTEKETMELMLKTQNIYAKEGFTTITDMAMTDDVYPIVKKLGDSNQLKLDIGMAYYATLTKVERVKELYSSSYNNHYRVIGGKLNLDGGSPGRTAYLRTPYYTETKGQPSDYRGYSSIVEQKTMNQLVGSYYKEKIPFFIHALGDAALDQCIAAVKYSEQNFKYDDIRTNLIHLQIVQPDQLESLKSHDVTMTFQIAHNFYFADFHNEFIYGPERTARLNPMKEALDNGYSVTYHHDSPVHPVDQIYLMWIATNRESRSGTVYGAVQRLSAYEALYAGTAESAYQLFEEKNKGSLEVGKIADLVVLSKNPLKEKISDIKNIDVITTIKDGSIIFSAN